MNDLFQLVLADNLILFLSLANKCLVLTRGHTHHLAEEARQMVRIFKAKHITYLTDALLPIV